MYLIALRIDVNGDWIRLGAMRDRDGRTISEGLHHLDGVAHHAVRVDDSILQRDRARLRDAHQKDVVDQREQMRRGVIDVGDAILPLDGAEPAMDAGEQRLGKADNGVMRLSSGQKIKSASMSSSASAAMTAMSCSRRASSNAACAYSSYSETALRNRVSKA